MPERKRVTDLGIVVLVYLVYVGLLTTTFWAHLFPRIIWYSMCCVSVANEGKDDRSVGLIVIFYFIMLIFVEVIFYVQMKSHVKLLLASKMVKF